MALPASGPLSLGQVAGEFGGTAPHSLSEYYSAAAGVPTSGTISIASFYGKSAVAPPPADFTLTLASNAASPDLRALALAAGWDGNARLIVNVTAQYINTLRANQNYPRGLRLNLSAGTLVGGLSGGGDALLASVPVEISNAGTIAGGGGNGGNGGSISIGYTGAPNDQSVAIGGLGEGGRGQGFASSTATVPTAAQPGGSGTSQTWPGTTWGEAPPVAHGGSGGGGGAWGNAGQGGSGAYATGPYFVRHSLSSELGGAAGRAVVGNNNITWITTGTRLGQVI